MSDDDKPTVARWGSGGDVMLMSPNGRVQFVSLWGFVRFIWRALKDGKKIKVVE